MYETNKHFRRDIGFLAHHCVTKYVKEMGWSKSEDIVINMQDMYESVIYPEYEIVLITGVDLGEHDGNKILGKTIMHEKKIFIEQSISDNNHPEFAWTVAHEIGHALLHTERDLLLPYTAEQTIFNEYSLNEMHADYFAELLITPHKLLGDKFVRHYGSWNVFSYSGPGEYFIDQVSCYVSSLIDLYQKLAEPLTHYFSNISVKYLANTMQKLRFIEDETIKPIVVEKIENSLKKGSVLHNFITSLDRK